VTLALTPAQRTAAILAAGKVERQAFVSLVGVDGTKLSDAKRDELLAKCTAGEFVELTIEIVAYEHKAGEPNRRHVRLSDEAVMSAARSAIGRPFLRDHEQANSLARGGTILESKGVRASDGRYEIRQRVKLTAPWAVDLALRGLLTFLSIGLRATGPVLCSLCGTEFLDRCGHMPGEITASGTCEWVFSSAEVVETSGVNVPAVPGAHIESIRAALSAAGNNSGSPPHRGHVYTQIATILSLAATAGETEILSAVEAQSKRLKALEAEHARLKEAQLAAQAKSFIDDAIECGRISPADAKTWERLYAFDPQGTVTLMSERQIGTATPVGTPRQSRDIATFAPTDRSAAANARLSAAGVNPDAVRNFARMFGAKDIDKTITDALGSKE
jgi:hypothetical protein